jgi:chromosome segregation ATPase
MIDIYDLEQALIDASQWQQFILNFDEEELPYKELRDICIKRCLDKHNKIIQQSHDRILELENEIEVLETENETEIRDLESEIRDLQTELNITLLPDNTLDDTDKIEFIQKNWDKLNYENLKSIVTPELIKDNIIETLKEEIYSLKEEIYSLKQEIIVIQNELEECEDENQNY